MRHAAAGRFDDTNHNADSLLLFINTFYENRANFVSSKNWQLLEDIRIHFKIGSALCPLSGHTSAGAELG